MTTLEIMEQPYAWIEGRGEAFRAAAMAWIGNVESKTVQEMTIYSDGPKMVGILPQVGKCDLVHVEWVGIPGIREVFEPVLDLIEDAQIRH